MSRTSLHRPRRPRAVWDRSVAGTRLLPSPFLPPGDGRSIDPSRHTHPTGPCRGYALFLRRPAPATCQGLCPDFVGSPEASAPRVYSPVAPLGTPSSHGDGKEDTPDLLRTVESVWDSFPFLDSPVVPLGEPHPSSNGSESALPSLRMVKRFPHTDRPEVPSRLVPSRSGAGWSPSPRALVTALPSPSQFSLSFRGPARDLGRGIPLSRTLRKSFPNPRRRQSIKLARHSINLQSRPINYQSTTNQDQSIDNQPPIKANQSPPCRTPPSPHV